MYNRTSNIKKILLRALVITVIVVAVNQLSIKVLIERKPDYIAGFTATWDLLAMSAEQGHTGITKDFPEGMKQRVTDIYQTHGWFLFLYDNNEGFLTYPNVEKKFRRTATTAYWLKEIRKDTISYLKMRWKTASRMFTRETLGFQQSPLYLWNSYKSRAVPEFLPSYFESNQLDPEKIKRSEGELNLFARLYGSVLTGYMYFVPGNWGIPIIGLLMLFVSLFLIKKGFRSCQLTSLIFMNVTALAWYIPLLVVVQIPAARYVFPSNSLIVFSIPVFAAVLLEASNYFSWIGHKFPIKSWNSQKEMD
jgi:hypothetical protein